MFLLIAFVRWIEYTTGLDFDWRYLLIAFVLIFELYELTLRWITYEEQTKQNKNQKILKPRKELKLILTFL